MPELPEVETTARYITDKAAGRRVISVTVNWHRSVDRPGLAKFKSGIIGTRLEAVQRRGKYLILPIVKGCIRRFILVHLRMSGSIDVVRSCHSRSAHDHIVLGISGGLELRFNDPRKFGRMYLVPDSEIVTGRLGIEPLSPEFSAIALAKLLRGRRGAIKPLLLRQDLVAGLGNIYVDESLWRARIHPLTAAAELSMASVRQMHSAIIATLKEALENCGTDFGDGVVEGGSYAPRVYDREGEKCGRCGAIIKKIIVSQRGTCFCPVCQPADVRSGS